MTDTTPTTTPTKAIVAAVVSALGTLATGLVVLLPDNDTVKLIGGGLALIATVVGTAYGVYQAQNVPTDGAPPLPELVDDADDPADSDFDRPHQFTDEPSDDPAGPKA